MQENDKNMSEPGASSASMQHTRVRHVEVTKNELNQRIDNFLLRRCPGVPRTHIYRTIRKGEVRVDGKRVKPTRKLAVGEKVRIPPMQLKSSQRVRVPDDAVQAVIDNIVFEHADFLILNKPPGLAVHAGSGVPFGAIDALQQGLETPTLELSHRLDKDTSGALLVARNAGTNRQLQDLFRERQVDKQYLALVDGQWPATLTELNAPLLKNTEQAGERKVVVDPAGQSATTHVTVIQRYRDSTLLDVVLETGRTHQIRVHVSHAGHAVVGDTRYGNNARNASFRRQGLKRMFLHAAALGFVWQGDRIDVECLPGTRWAQAIDRLDII